MASRVGCVLSLVISLVLISAINTASFVNARSNGFSIDLMHRDSSDSPFYNPRETPSERIGNAIRRTMSRVNRFTSRNYSELSSPIAPLIANDGEYLMNISLGSPPFPVLAIADTGSDIIWTQCQPCTDCYKQDAPIFDPKLSSTYRPVPFPRMIFGCGHDNTGIFSPKGAGIIGLGEGPASLISQLGPSVGGKFSYCMVPYDATPETTSTMHFGQKAVVSGGEVVTTPLLSSELGSTFYSLLLESVSVGSTTIPFGNSNSETSSTGNIIIDSGTTLTIVPTDFLSNFATAIEAQVTGGNKTRDPQGLLSLCYLTVTCLAFYGSDEVSIYGNLAQQDFLVGYDLQKRTVSFKPTDCTKN
ncbi:Aspartic proteinase CDR1 [Linum grandiflorum]